MERKSSPEELRLNHTSGPETSRGESPYPSTTRNSSSVPWNGDGSVTSNNDDFPNSNPLSSPSPHLVFPCPKPYKGISNFDAMIPSEVKNPSAQVVTVTIKQPDTVTTRVPDIFPPAPTDLGTVTEVITKSTLTETVFTRV